MWKSKNTKLSPPNSQEQPSNTYPSQKQPGSYSYGYSSELLACECREGAPSKGRQVQAGNAYETHADMREMSPRVQLSGTVYVKLKLAMLSDAENTQRGRLRRR